MPSISPFSPFPFKEKYIYTLVTFCPFYESDESSWKITYIKRHTVKPYILRNQQGRLITNWRNWQLCSSVCAKKLPAQPNLEGLERTSYLVGKYGGGFAGKSKTNKFFSTPTLSFLLKGKYFLKIFTGSISSSPPKFLLIACSISSQRGSRPCSLATLYTILTKLKSDMRKEWFKRLLFYLNINVNDAHFSSRLSEHF